MTLAIAIRSDQTSVRCEQARDYSVFGGVLRSAIEFPELPVIAGDCAQPDWVLVIERVRPPVDTLTEVGERLVGRERYKLWRSQVGLRLQYSHAGTFDISSDGKRIVWYYDETAQPELVRSIVLGPAIALALELAGLLCLHGSAVSLRRGGVAFLGPKHFGKSTLATALTAAGGRLLGDDLLVVDPAPPVTVRPGVASVRLWADMAAALPLDRICDTMICGVKTTVTGFTSEALATAPTELTNVYLLSPIGSNAVVGSVVRKRLTPVEAAIALARQAKIPDSLVGLRAAASRLAGATAVARRVPVWTLHVARDLTKLEETVRQLLDWSHCE